MQNTYISQLISALEQAAVHPPLKPYDERVLHFEVDPEAAEKALVPFKSIGQWTGIDKSSFPTMAQVTGEQCEQINKAILRVFDSLNLTIVDIPEEINPLIFYVVLTTNWDCMVQYLSLSGTELQFFKDSDEDRYHRAMSGIFNDDGSKVDVNNIPLPSLCVICKYHMADDWEENILCLMNRLDQRDEDDFNCGQFEKLYFY